MLFYLPTVSSLRNILEWALYVGISGPFFAIKYMLCFLIYDSGSLLLPGEFFYVVYKDNFTDYFSLIIYLIMVAGFTTHIQITTIRLFILVITKLRTDISCRKYILLVFLLINFMSNVVYIEPVLESFSESPTDRTFLHLEPYMEYII